MAGFENQVMVAKNVNFDHLSNPPHNGIVTADGQLLIGSTADPNNAIVANTLTAGTGISITNGPGTITIASTAATTDLHTARYIVSSSGTSGTGANYTTISSAVSAAQITGVPSTVFIQPGTYTENFTLPANINLAAYDGDALTPTVTIVGNITCSDAGSRSISGIRLQTNGAAFLTVSGSVATVVNLNNCYLNASNATGISFTSSSASATINISGCSGNLGTTGIKIYTSTSAGTINFESCLIRNTGGSSTASDNSAGLVNFYNCTILVPVSGTVGVANTQIDTSAISAICVTGTANIFNSYLASENASAISASGLIAAYNSIINSKAANAITGAGTINYGTLYFPNSITINTTTQTAAGAIQGITAKAPTVGYIGQKITNSATSVSLSNATAANITSISLTPGNWFVTGNVFFFSTGNSTINQVQITSTSATLSGSAGVEIGYWSAPSALQNYTISAVDQYITLTSTTTYYLVAQCNFSSGTCVANGTMTAIRVG